jgi:cytochrome d ubiquinol oxidase subunit I
MAKHQPAKLAATEARWETNTEGGAPFLPIAFPDMKAEKNRFQIAIPNGLSLLITHSMDGKIPGLKDFPRDERPNAAVIFWTFRAMAGIGFLFVAVMVWAAFLWRRKRLYATPLFLKTLLVLQPVGFVATVAGWITAEMGRQPWTVYGLLRTTDGVSPIAAGNVLWSLAMFSAFFVLIGASYFYYVFRTIRLGPDMESPIPPLQRPAGFEPSRSVEVNP